MNNRWKHRAAAGTLLAAWTAVAIAGCAQSAIDADVGSATQLAESPISLRVTGVEGYNETLARLSGKVVLVDFWATWCAPCIEQFPHTVALARKYRDRGLAVVSVSLNEPVDLPQVQDFLTRHEAHFDNLLSNYPGGVKAIRAFNLPGPVPCYRVYDRSGVLRREFVVNPRAQRQFTPDDIEAAVAELL
jgi:thiol-disulfide isomerase/thioredoxin